MNTTQNIQLWYHNLQQSNRPIFVADRIVSNQEVLIQQISELETQLEQSKALLAETNSNLEHALIENEHLKEIASNTKPYFWQGVRITILSEIIVASILAILSYIIQVV